MTSTVLVLTLLGQETAAPRGLTITHLLLRSDLGFRPLNKSLTYNMLSRVLAVFNSLSKSCFSLTDFFSSHGRLCGPPISVL